MAKSVVSIIPVLHPELFRADKHIDEVAVLFNSINAFRGCFFHKSVIKLTHNGAAYPRDNLSLQQEQ